MISIISPTKRLESIAKLANQHEQGSGVSGLNRGAMETFLNDIEGEISLIRETEAGEREIIDECIMSIEARIAPLNFFILEIRPIIRNSIHRANHKEYSAGKAQNLLTL